MLKDILKQQNLEDSQVEAIISAMNEAKIYTTSLENADIRYNKIQEQNKQYAEASKNYEKQLKDLSKNNSDNEELKKQLEQLQLSNKELEANHIKEMEKLQFDFKLDSALSSSKAKDNKLVKALLSLDDIKFNEGKLEGLEGQIEAIKSTHGYLFDEEVKASGGFNPQTNNNGKYFTREDVSKMSASEINANWDIIQNMNL